MQRVATFWHRLKVFLICFFDFYELIMELYADPVAGGKINFSSKCCANLTEVDTLSRGSISATQLKCAGILRIRPVMLLRQASDSCLIKPIYGAVVVAFAILCHTF